MSLPLVEPSVSIARSVPATLENILLLGKCSLTLLTFARSCRRHGIRPYLVEVGDGEPQWNSFSSALAGGIKISQDDLDSPAVTQTILTYARRVGAPALVPDTSINIRQVIGYRPALEPQCRVIAATAEALAIEDDKLRQIALAREVGFQILPTWPLASRKDIGTIPVDAFPLCVRPTDVRIRPRFKALFIRDRCELQALLDRTTFNGSAIVAQPFIDAPNLKMHGVRALSGEMLAERGFWTSRKFKNVTLSLTQAPLPDAVRRSCRQFVERCGLVGNYQFDLIGWGNPEIYYLEINPRAGGTTDKVCRLGFDEPMLTLAAFGYRPPLSFPAVSVPSRRIVVNKRTVLRHIVAAAKGELTPLDYPGGSRLHHVLLSCRELVSAQDSVFDWADLKGTLRYHCRAPQV